MATIALDQGAMTAADGNLGLVRENRLTFPPLEHGRSRKKEISMKFEVPEMSCGHCVSSIEKAVSAADPAASVQTDLDTRTIRVASSLSPNEVMHVLKETGYDATQSPDNDPA